MIDYEQYAWIAPLTSISDQQKELLGKMLAFSAEFRLLEAQKLRIIREAIPSYASSAIGHPGGLAMVGEVGPELEMSPDGLTYKLYYSRVRPLPGGTQP